MMLDGYTIRFVFGFSKNGMRRFSTAGLLTPDHLRYYDKDNLNTQAFHLFWQAKGISIGFMFRIIEQEAL
jgi:hypothetical protein